eukprot:TRINITY_DN13057_c0_g1_i1.p1 TRINITY_DN13057_c0_g1~~TRINITY_DN13057_c0_g1_i1.p1  ORF type:complete len:67 (-),score=5.53 TRINITY_DN13057_c0_g1_i1:80-280(-)
MLEEHSSNTSHRPIHHTSPYGPTYTLYVGAFGGDPQVLSVHTKFVDRILCVKMFDSIFPCLWTVCV